MLNTATRSTLSATTLIGDDVNNRAGETVGSLKDIMLDLDSGQVAYAVVAVGGFLGMGERLFAVPWNSLELDAENHALIFDVDKERLSQAPGFDADQWPDMSDRTWGRSIYDFYGTRPHWRYEPAHSKELPPNASWLPGNEGQVCQAAESADISKKLRVFTSSAGGGSVPKRLDEPGDIG